MTRLVDINLNHFPLPIKVTDDKDYYIELKNTLDRYIMHLEGQSAKCF